jgi:hypothetical protein
MAPGRHHLVKSGVDIPDCVFDSSGILQEVAEKEFIKQDALRYFGLIYDVNMVSLSLFHF